MAVTQSSRRSTPSLGRHLGRPAQLAPGLADVRDEDSLVARAPGVEARLEGAPQAPLQVAITSRMARVLAGPPPTLKTCPLTRPIGLDRPVVGVQQVVDPEHVPHLHPVAVDGDRPPQGGGDAEPGHPALVLHPQLARAVDAGLAQGDRGQAVDAGVVDGVLVAGPLRHP